MTILDPRERNQLFSNDSIASYLSDYSNELKRAIQSIDKTELKKSEEILSEYYKNNKFIFAIGNGGSHAIADHLACDFVKGSYKSSKQRFRVIPLGSLSSLNSAAANDFGHEKSFSKIIEFLGEEDGLLIAISSSGNSKNIIEAVEYNRSRGGKTIGLTGFDGGELKKISDASLHVNANNYGIVEDAHQSIMHIFSQYFLSST
ncbi:MAG: phosphoheptose isomerase [Candidatus Marinimicrobia bacterium]|nr:phosphoheptose isomerase [Candidatus Neomarinimicrobiota bacterium]|tara:strand:+ start:4066 stop:4674 length:609 start_codon:yes stop_codon:yes gene_type:complete